MGTIESVEHLLINLLEIEKMKKPALTWYLLGKPFSKTYDDISLFLEHVQVFIDNKLYFEVSWED